MTLLTLLCCGESPRVPPPLFSATCDLWLQNPTTHTTICASPSNRSVDPKICSVLKFSFQLSEDETAATVRQTVFLLKLIVSFTSKAPQVLHLLQSRNADAQLISEEGSRV